MLIVACAGKFLGGVFSTYLLGEPWKESFALGVFINTRGLVELIVLNIDLSLGVLSPSPFAMLVIMALLTTMMASPILDLFSYRQMQR